MRKFAIGFVSLCVVLAVYLLYSRLSSSPAIDTGPEIDIIKSASDANAVGLDNEIGKIGDVGIGPVRKAKYVTLNENKEIEREFGFEKLLNETRDIWDIEKPYMNIYRRHFKCYVTADKGKVQVETAVGRTTPKDATFSSNVVIHIISGPSDNIKESFVYLDNIIFLSEKSRLSTADPCDPVKFVSEDIRMDGTGLVLIYNELTERLEYFLPARFATKLPPKPTARLNPLLLLTLKSQNHQCRIPYIRMKKNRAFIINVLLIRMCSSILPSS
jgi:hypothetical protein